MSESLDDERARIREQKKRELQERLEDGASLDDTGSETTGTPTDPIHVDGPDHLSEVVSTNDVVLVDFYADWCGPCKMLEPTVEALAKESEAAVAKVDIDAHQRMAQQHGVRGVPTLVLYANGEPAERTSGVQDRATLERLIGQYT
ncbi:thioredoxin [Halovivax asiaticus JCM 14624]|uniref:Thioredoxin n=1 Tax=Halovivax asiaticus JCM 14624 TaxID=1227490 RepID=M0BIL1_9EURY|nr:thioredoxin [Halovivax asiaticus]ELZ10726.1 thioredoxin [Halovivax asiaticus JCM 14624]